MIHPLFGRTHFSRISGNEVLLNVRHGKRFEQLPDENRTPVGVESDDSENYQDIRIFQAERSQGEIMISSIPLIEQLIIATCIPERVGIIYFTKVRFPCKINSLH